MEIFPTNVLASDRGCFGCQRHEKDIMLSFMVDRSIERKGEYLDPEVVHDIFLDDDQAKALYKVLGERLRYNEEMVST